MPTHSKTSMIASSQQDAHQSPSFVKSCWEALNSILTAQAQNRFGPLEKLGPPAACRHLKISRMAAQARRLLRMAAQARSLLRKMPAPPLSLLSVCTIVLGITPSALCQESPKKPAPSATKPALAASSKTGGTTTSTKTRLTTWPKSNTASTKQPAASNKAKSTTSQKSNAPSTKSPGSAKSSNAQTKSTTKTTKPPATTSAKHPIKSTVKRPVRRITRPPIPAIPAVVNAQGKPIWLNVDDGLKAGKALKKYVVADFYTDWCGWCKVLDKTTFHDPAVEAFLAKNAVCMKVNSEDNKRGSSLSEDFEVSGWPTVIIFDSAGREVDRNAGFMPAPQFLDWVRKTIPQKK